MSCENPLRFCSTVLYIRRVSNAKLPIGILVGILSTRYESGVCWSDIPSVPGATVLDTRAAVGVDREPRLTGRSLQARTVESSLYRFGALGYCITYLRCSLLQL